MSFYELDSVEIKSKELRLQMDKASLLSFNKPIFIVGEESCGKYIFAGYVLKKALAKGIRLEVKKNIETADVVHGLGVYTVRSSQWSDLQLRLASYEVLFMPTLAQRKADLPALAGFAVKVLGLMHDKSQVLLTAKAIEKLLQYNWPGQFKELESVLENAVSKNKTGFIEPEDLKITSPLLEMDMPIGLKLEDLERKYILQTLYFAHQNRTKAADLLGISIRTLRNKINQYREEGYL